MSMLAQNFVHHYCDGCHLEVMAEKPAFYGLQHRTLHGLLLAGRLLSAVSEIILAFFIGSVD